MLTAAKFIARDHCISCRSGNLAELSGGDFGDDPLRSFIENDPWGEDPMPALRNERWSLVACGDCGQKFHRNILTPEWCEVRFNKWMSQAALEQFQAVHETNNAVGHVQHALRLRELGVRRLLDFGCGFGKFLEMASLFGIEAVGVDRSSGRRAGASFPIYADLSEADGTFDAITLFEVLEHLDDPLDTLLALKARLNPGGIMIVEVPDATGVEGINSQHDYRTVHPIEHINAFTPDSLAKFMRLAGFKPLRKQPAFVAMSLGRVAKDIAKAAVKQQTTQRYFTTGRER